MIAVMIISHLKLLLFLLAHHFKPEVTVLNDGAVYWACAGRNIIQCLAVEGFILYGVDDTSLSLLDR